MLVYSSEITLLMIDWAQTSADHVDISFPFFINKLNNYPAKLCLFQENKRLLAIIERKESISSSSIVFQN
jgi:hypothetical protein